ncbi:hypothetical protein J9303_16185, partial [Bacillaceae bacterium Marseille-Q3522]|nr:hypothetical protein [Bacillaceae bacterium Marseille-Q3522]
MKIGNYLVLMSKKLLEQLDVEGIILHPSVPQFGLLVMSSKDDTFTLHFFKLEIHGKYEYRLVKKLTSRLFTNFID